ncbi:EcsC family protein [Spirobacillus cienkowskii]|uniref:EcsC family protein n=1 Tax=Spirobacillus cienkowskii TaxID=495820 RepID=UPI0030CC67F0
MFSKISDNIIMKALEWAYEKAISQSLPGVESAFSLASSYQKTAGNLEQKIDSLIRWQNAKAVAVGFGSGLGGIIAVPISIPANIAAVLFVQVRMISAIAHMNGYDLQDERVKTMIFACMYGSGVEEVLKSLNLNYDPNFKNIILQKVTKETIVKINNAVKIRMFSRFGTLGPISFGKAVPLLGAFVGGAYDGFCTNAIGTNAKKLFLKKMSLSGNT